MRVRARVLATCIFASAAVIAPLAHAQDGPDPAKVERDKQRAAALKAEGDAAMEKHEYETAVTKYKAALDASDRNPAILYNLGRVYEAQENFPAELACLLEFQAKADDDLKAKVPKLEELIRDVTPRVGGFSLGHVPPGATVQVDQSILAQKTPIEGPDAWLKPGLHTFTVTKEGFFPVTKANVMIQKFDAMRRLTPIDISLSSKRDNGMLSVPSAVAGADVLVDGKSYGKAPTDVPLAPGSHRVVLQRPGYDSVDTNVVIRSGETRVLENRITPTDTITKKWWFWTAIGVAVAAGTTATVLALTNERDPDRGSIPPGRVKAELGIGF